ncbi:MAG: TlpA disulfide reductase family protein [Pirellulales bacterium]
MLDKVVSKLTSKGWLAILMFAAYVVSFSGVSGAHRQLLADEKSAAEKSIATSSMRLRLKNNAFGVGKLVPSANANKVGWQNEGFVEPFFIDTSAIRIITAIQASHADLSTVQNLFLVEASDGQCVLGEIQKIDDESITVKSPILGSVELNARKVAQILRADYSGEVIYPGLSQQSVWNRLGNVADWEYRAGVLTAVKQAAAINGDVKLPAKCEITIALSWKGVPDFVVSIGAGSNEKSNGQVASSARLEIWNRNLVLVRETEKDADLAKLMELNEKNPQVELSLLLDQESGLVVVRDIHGRKLGKTQVVDQKKRLGSAIHIVNHGPSMSIERLEVRAWDGTSMLGLDQNQHVFLRENRVLESSWISQVDSAAEQFIVEDSSGEKKPVPMKDVILAGLKYSSEAKPKASGSENQIDLKPLDLKPKGKNQDEPKSTDAPDGITIDSAQGGGIEVVLADRSRVKGQWLPSSSGRLNLRSTWCKSDFAFEDHHVVSLVGSEQRFSPDLTSHRNGIVKIGDTEFAGFLEENVSEAGSLALRWHPHGSDNSSAVASSAEGSIAYRLQLPMAANGQPTGRVDELLNQQKDAQSKPATEAGPGAKSTREMVFISGDTIDGYVEKIDEKGVTFVSEQTTVRFAEHSRFDRVWLNSMAGSLKKSTNVKIQRLMTVPRSMKDDPPTHLLVSVTGDLLRGRLVSLDEDIAKFEVRSDIADIPRSQIAELIWLHERKWDVTSKPQLPVQDRYQIHVVQQNRGLTFSPTKIADASIHGESLLLGSCQVSIKQVSQILFGPNIDQRVAQFRENPWVLSLAQLPRVFTEDSDASLTPLGVSSPLLGKPAPAFKAVSLDGKRIQLSDVVGKTLVIDFWASWCGPCMKTLPTVNTVVGTYDPSEVSLLAMNIQEAEARIEAAAKRLELDTNLVSLDQDGDIALKYLATAIPQTVVIDKQGIVRFVFVGGRSNLAAELKDAIDQCKD